LQPRQQKKEKSRAATGHGENGGQAGHTGSLRVYTGRNNVRQ